MISNKVFYKGWYFNSKFKKIYLIPYEHKFLKIIFKKFSKFTIDVCLLEFFPINSNKTYMKLKQYCLHIFPKHNIGPQDPNTIQLAVSFMIHDAYKMFIVLMSDIFV